MKNSELAALMKHGFLVEFPADCTDHEVEVVDRVTYAQTFSVLWQVMLVVMVVLSYYLSPFPKDFAKSLFFSLLGIMAFAFLGISIFCRRRHLCCSKLSNIEKLVGESLGSITRKMYTEGRSVRGQAETTMCRLAAEVYFTRNRYQVTFDHMEARDRFEKAFNIFTELFSVEEKTAERHLENLESSQCVRNMVEEMRKREDNPRIGVNPRTKP